jgi:hypothetical protein
MLALRYVAMLTLVVWVGGLIVLGGVAAPSIFDVVAARGVAGGREIAGAIFGETLRRFHLVAYAAGGLLLLTLVSRRILGPRPRRFAWRTLIAAAMLASTVFSGVYVVGQMAVVQQEIGGSPSSLAPSDARRVRFERLHELATGLECIPILGGLLLMYWELKG